MSYKWFIGIVAWDSWKQVVATTYFNEELAKDNVRALFDYQIKVMMQYALKMQELSLTVFSIIKMKIAVVMAVTGMNEILNQL